MKPVVKQKFGPLARIAFMRAHEEPNKRLVGHAEIFGPLTLTGVIITPLSGNFITIEIDANQLEELAKPR